MRQFWLNLEQIFSYIFATSDQNRQSDWQKYHSVLDKWCGISKKKESFLSQFPITFHFSCLFNRISCDSTWRKSLFTIYSISRKSILICFFFRGIFQECFIFCLFLNWALCFTLNIIILWSKYYSNLHHKQNSKPYDHCNFLLINSKKSTNKTWKGYYR